VLRESHFRCLHGLLDGSRLVQLQHSVRKFVPICVDSSIGLTLPLDFPWLERDDLELALTFQLKALRYSYNAKLDKSAGKYLGYTYLSQFGEFAVTGPETDGGAASRDCDIVDVLMTRPPTGEDRIREDQGALGDFLLSTTSSDGGVLVLGSQLSVRQGGSKHPIAYLRAILLTAFQLDHPGIPTTPSESSLPGTTASTPTASETVLHPPSDSPGGSSETVAIAASVAGTLAVVFILIGMCLGLRRYRARRQRSLTPLPVASTGIASSTGFRASSGVESSSGVGSSSGVVPLAVGGRTAGAELSTKLDRTYAVLAGKPTTSPFMHSVQSVPATSSAHMHADPNEEERVLRELRGAMATSGHTVNTLFAQLAGSNEAGGSGSPSVPPAYDHRH